MPEPRNPETPKPLNSSPKQCLKCLMFQVFTDSNWIRGQEWLPPLNGNNMFAIQKAAPANVISCRQECDWNKYNPCMDMYSLKYLNTSCILGLKIIWIVFFGLSMTLKRHWSNSPGEWKGMNHVRFMTNLVYCLLIKQPNVEHHETPFWED